MYKNLIKFKSKFLTQYTKKVMIARSFSGRKSNRNNDYNESKALKRVNFFGMAGIASAIVASYIIVRKSQNDQTVKYIKGNGDNKVFAPNLAQEFSNVSGDNHKEERLREQYNFIRKVVHECANAVFYLELRDPYIKDPETGQSIITSNGSGFIISEDGWALTNAHVVLNKPQSTITAIMRDGRSYNVKVEDADMNIDLALLKLEAKEKLPSLQFGEPGDTAVGEWVVALGSPLSLSNSVTVGIISSVERPAEELGLKNYSMTYIQTDASITFGNSGGPLVNLDCNVIGINNLRLTSGISFAIPVEYAKRFLENSKYGIKSANVGHKVGKTLFGLTTISLTPELLTDLDKEKSNIPKDVTKGLLVWKIIPGTPAHKSGLEVGDIITHVNGIPIQKPTELYNFSSARNVLDIGVINKGKKRNVILDLE